MADVVMDFDVMEQMYQIFQQGSQVLEQTASTMQNIASMLEGGALLGKGGEAFAHALRERLTPRVMRMRDKFDELAGDIIGALTDLRDNDKSAASRFK